MELRILCFFCSLLSSVAFAVLGPRAPGGCFWDGPQCQRLGEGAWWPEAAASSAVSCRASRKLPSISEPDGSSTTQFWISTYWKTISHMPKTVSHFFSNKKIRGNLSPAGEQRLCFSETMGLFSSWPHYVVECGTHKSRFNITPYNLFNWRTSGQ